MPARATSVRRPWDRQPRRPRWHAGTGSPAVAAAAQGRSLRGPSPRRRAMSPLRAPAVRRSPRAAPGGYRSRSCSLLRAQQVGGEVSADLAEVPADVEPVQLGAEREDVAALV